MFRNHKAQSSVEYMLLYGIILALGLVSFKYFMDKTRQHTIEYHNTIAKDLKNS
ncbi:MAG: hypothetical protein HQL25_07965 [Candidatus Omnitrophica bacterium]|nr:hypothetical protein [Candidatus Omnitrophota bacterium]